MKRVVLLLVMVVAVSGLSSAAGDPASGDVLLRAMQDELQRSMKQLKLENAAAPYFIGYAVSDVEAWDLHATCGSLTESDRNRSRTVGVTVRVGSYSMDSGGTPTPGNLVVEDDYDALRQDLWLLTDSAYKRAVVQIAQKKAAQESSSKPQESADFSREKPTVLVAPRQKLAFDRARWEKLVKHLSAVIRSMRAVQTSDVTFNVSQWNKALVSSEGTITCQPTLLWTLTVEASAQARDGMELRDSLSFVATSLDHGPSELVMEDRVRKMGEELTAMAAAPLLDKYIGPVLMTGPAASETLAHVLAPQLAGSGDLSRRLNRRVMPSFLNVVDDPTRQQVAGQDLVGSYAVDDEGVASHPVKLVERGYLKTLLMSRRPRKEIEHSNGHARAGLGRSSAAIGNLLIESTQGKSFAVLKQQLIANCKEQNMAFGLIIRAVDGGPNSSLRAYRIWVKDGREELVRGVTLSGFPLQTLKDIQAAGNDYYVDNRPPPGSIFGFGGEPSSIVCPSLLFDELELNAVTGTRVKPALLHDPFFSPEP